MSITRLGQYGGPKTDVFGGSHGGKLLEVVSAINNAINLVDGYKGAVAYGVNLNRTAIVGNNTILGNKVIGVYCSDSTMVNEVDYLNNAEYYTSSTNYSTGVNCVDKGGNFKVRDTSGVFLPRKSIADDYGPSRLAEAGMPFAVDPNAVYPEDVMWQYDSLGSLISGDNWTVGCVKANYGETTIPISAGINTDIMANTGQGLQIGIDGIARFDKEPVNVFFGRGLRLDYTAMAVDSSGNTHTFPASTYVDIKVDNTGRNWKVVGVDGGQAFTTGYLFDGVYHAQKSTVKAFHVLTDLNSAMKINQGQNGMAKAMGFRSGASLPSAKLNVDIAMYNCKSYTNLVVTTAPETDPSHKIRLYSPRDASLDCVQTQRGDWRRSRTAGSGFKNINPSVRVPLIQIEAGNYFTVEGLRFQQAPKQPGDSDFAVAGIASVYSFNMGVDVDVINCVFLNTSFVVILSSGVASGNVVYNSDKGIAAGGNDIVICHNTVIDTKTSAIAVTQPGSGFLAYNNMCVAAIGGACIIGNGNCTVLANTCNDASGTDRRGLSVSAVDPSAIFVSLARGDYRPLQLRGLWENKAVISLHCRRQPGDVSIHDFTASVTDLPQTVVVPAQFLPAMTRVLQMSAQDMNGRQRQDFDFYSGALEYYTNNIHVSIGQYNSTISGFQISFLDPAIPSGSGETLIPSWLFRITNAGSAQNLNGLLPGVLIKTSGGNFQVAERITDTVWRMADTSPNPGVNLTVISAGVNTGRLKNLTTPIGASNAMAALLNTSDLIASHLTAYVHVLGYDIVDSLVEIRGINSMSTNRIWISSADTSSILLYANNGKIRFVNVNGAGVRGLQLTTFDTGMGQVQGLNTTAVEFENCAEPAFRENICIGLDSGVKLRGDHITFEAANNVFDNCRAGIDGRHLGFQAPEYQQFKEFNVGPRGADVGMRLWASGLNTWASFDQVEAMSDPSHIRIQVIVNNAVVIPTVSMPTWSSPNWVITVTMANHHTWSDVVQSLSPDNPWVTQGWFGAYNGSGPSLAIKPCGQQVVSAQAFAGNLVIRNFSEVEPPSMVWLPAQMGNSGFYANAENESTSAIHNNTFIRCRTGIDIQASRDIIEANSFVYNMINNVFCGCEYDTSCQELNSAAIVDHMNTPGESLYTAIWCGNVSDSKWIENKIQIDCGSGLGSRNNQLTIIPDLNLNRAYVDVRVFGLGMGSYAMIWGSTWTTSYAAAANPLVDYWPGSDLMYQLRFSSGRAMVLAHTDINGMVRNPRAWTPGAVDVQDLALGSAEINEIEISVLDVVNSAFTGYLVNYYLTYNPAAKQFYGDDGVANVGLVDGMSFSMGNIAVINDHICYSLFVGDARVYVDAAATAYTMGLPLLNPDNTPDELENRLVAEGLTDLRIDDRHGNWFWRDLAIFQTMHPAFCGCFHVYSNVIGFRLSIQTNPDQYAQGTAVIVGRGPVYSGGDGGDQDLQSTQIGKIVHSNTHDARWRNPGNDKMLSGIWPDTGVPDFTVNAKAMLVFGNMCKVEVNNIRIIELDNWPYSNGYTTLFPGSIPSLFEVNGSSQLSIYNSELGYFMSLLTMDSGSNYGNVQHVSVLNNAVIQYDMAKQKSGATAFDHDLEITTSGAIDKMAMLPYLETSNGGPAMPITGVPMTDLNGRPIDFVFANNDVMVYNQGQADSSTPTSFEFIGELSSDPASPRYNGSVKHYNNRLIHPCRNQDRGVDFYFGAFAGISGFDAKYPNTKATDVHGAVVLGDGYGGNTVVDNERVQCLDVDGYFSDENYADNQAMMQKFRYGDLKPTVASSAYVGVAGGYRGTDPIWKYTDVTSGPKFDIIGSSRYHRDGSVDIGAFYISYLQTSFGRDDIIDINQISLVDVGTGLFEYRINGTNTMFTPVVKPKAKDYGVGTKMKIRVKPNLSDLDFVGYKPMPVIAIFEDTVFDDTSMTMLMPQSGTVNGVYCSGFFLDKIFQGLMSNRYILGYDYIKATATVYRNTFYGLGCTGDNSPVDQARFSENKMVVV